MLTGKEAESKREQITRYWDEFYAESGGAVPVGESDFARHVKEVCERIDILVEFGCGSGRDARWFANDDQCVVLATDNSRSALELLGTHIDTSERSRFVTKHVDLYDPESLVSLATLIGELRLNSSDSPRVVFYGRFLLHAIEEDAQSAFVQFAGSQLGAGGILALEYRVRELGSSAYEFGTHYRRPVDPVEVEKSCLSAGFGKVHTEISDSFAVYKSERPLIARTLAEI